MSESPSASVTLPVMTRRRSAWLESFRMGSVGSAASRRAVGGLARRIARGVVGARCAVDTGIKSRSDDGVGEGTSGSDGGVGVRPAGGDAGEASVSGLTRATTGALWTLRGPGAQRGRRACSRFSSSCSSGSRRFVAVSVPSAARVWSKVRRAAQRSRTSREVSYEARNEPCAASRYFARNALDAAVAARCMNRSALQRLSVSCDTPRGRRARPAASAGLPKEQAIGLTGCTPR
jgi:hypothetical protein